MVDGLKISAQRDQGSLLRELRVAASAAGHAIPVLREEHARPALRTVRPLPRDAIPVDLVELPLESRDALFLLRLGHHLPPFFFGSAFFSSFGASFFSAGFLSSLAGFFSSFVAGFSGFVSALASGFASGFAASAFVGVPGFSLFSARGACFSGFGAAFFSLTSGSISLLRTRMCLRSTARASSFVL